MVARISTSAFSNFSRFSSTSSSATSSSSASSSSRGNRCRASGKDSAASVRSTQSKGEGKRDGLPRMPRRRRVRFDFDENDQVRSTYHVYEKVSEMDRALVWVTACELRRMKCAVTRECQAFAASNQNFVDCLEKMIRTSPLSHLTDAASSDLSSQSFDRDAFVMHQLAREDSPRGLEYRMSSLILRHKRFTTTAVLQRQRQLSRLRSDTFSGGDSGSGSIGGTTALQWGTAASASSMPDALAALCAHLSQCTRELALAYGRADALWARDASGEKGSQLSLPLS